MIHDNTIALFCVSPRGYVYETFYYPKTDGGRKKAKDKRSELLARYPKADVEIYDD